MPLSQQVKKNILEDHGERKPSNNSNDFRVDILEFEVKLVPKEFLDCLSMVE